MAAKKKLSANEKLRHDRLTFYREDIERHRSAADRVPALVGGEVLRC